MVRSKVKIGVLALQGDFAEHKSVLDNLNVDCSIVKKPNELSELNGLIIPGGESTTIKKLIDRYDYQVQKIVSRMCFKSIFYLLFDLGLNFYL